MPYYNLLNNIVKNLGGRLTGCWLLARKFFQSDAFQALGPYIVGGFGVITCFAEGVKAINEAYKAYKNEAIGQRKTRILSSVLIILSAGAGIGLATTLMVAAAGVAISMKTALMAPIIIPMLFTSIYAMGLWRKAYIFYQARKNAARAKEDYEQALRQKDNNFELSKISPDELAAKKQRYEELYQARLLTERQLVFAAIDCLSSAAMTIATIMGTTAFFAASAASFGILPAGILILGLVAGYAAQAFEYFDRKANYAYTRSMRNGLVKTGEAIQNAYSRCKNYLLGNRELEQISPQELSKPVSLHKRMLDANLIEMTSLRPRQAKEARLEEKQAKQSKRKSLPSPESLIPEASNGSPCRIRPCS